MITFNDLTILWFRHDGDETHYVQSVSQSEVAATDSGDADGGAAAATIKRCSQSIKIDYKV